MFEHKRPFVTKEDGQKFYKTMLAYYEDCENNKEKFVPYPIANEYGFYFKKNQEAFWENVMRYVPEVLKVVFLKSANYICVLDSLKSGFFSAGKYHGNSPPSILEMSSMLQLLSGLEQKKEFVIVNITSGLSFTEGLLPMLYKNVRLINVDFNYKEEVYRSVVKGIQKLTGIQFEEKISFVTKTSIVLESLKIADAVIMRNRFPRREVGLEKKILESQRDTFFEFVKELKSGCKVLCVSEVCYKNSCQGALCLKCTPKEKLDSLSLDEFLRRKNGFCFEKETLGKWLQERPDLNLEVSESTIVAEPDMPVEITKVDKLCTFRMLNVLTKRRGSKPLMGEGDSSSRCTSELGDKVPSIFGFEEEFIMGSGEEKVEKRPTVFSPMMKMEKRCKNNWTSSVEKKRGASSTKLENYRILSKRSDSKESTKSLREATDFDKKVRCIKEQLMDICTPNVKSDIDNLNKVLIENFSDAIGEVSIKQNVIKITLINNRVVSSHIWHKGGALVTFEPALAVEIARLRQNKYRADKAYSLIYYSLEFAP